MKSQDHENESRSNEEGQRCPATELGVCVQSEGKARLWGDSGIGGWNNWKQGEVRGNDHGKLETGYKGGEDETDVHRHVHLRRWDNWTNLENISVLVDYREKKFL